ncbi:MAG: hypothetical protein CFH41_00555 [Alphaproteobacteria bacterium MarineAlpha11_Bin1]|nr:MAG: hypothetical protein CFH41_00555 [Alphaproteobacteria bacterium MarineAlpha11_Bin1]
MTQISALQATITDTSAEIGPIDILINYAGVIETEIKIKSIGKGGIEWLAKDIAM